MLFNERSILSNMSKWHGQDMVRSGCSQTLAFSTSQDISCVISLWNVIDEMTTVTASESVCVGVKPRANKEGGKSEKEKDREERAALWMLHIFCGSHNHNLSIQRFSKSPKFSIIFTEITFFITISFLVKESKHPYKTYVFTYAKLHRFHVMSVYPVLVAVFFNLF